MRIDEFIRARVAEDEAVARAAALRYGPKWSEDVRFVQFDDDEHNLYVIIDAEEREMMESAELSEWRATGHIARHDPARVLAECEAKQRIVAEHPLAEAEHWPNGIHYCEMCIDRSGNDGTWNHYPCPTLRILAAVYADHPDFDPAWRL